MTDRATIEEQGTDIIRDNLGVDHNKITPDAHFADDLGADSLDMVELTMAFEEAFSIEICDDDAEKVETVKDAFDLVERLGA